MDVDAERAIHLALLAVETTRSVDGSVLPEAVNALHHAVTTSRVLVNVPGVGGRLDWHPNAELFVTEGPEESGMVDIRSTTTGETVRSWRGDAIDVNDAKYSDDGTMLAVAGDDGILKVFDPTNGELVSAVEGSGPVWDPTFDHSGSVLLAQWPDEQRIRLVDPHTGDVLGDVEGGVQYLEISPDGNSVAVINLVDGPGVSVLDLATQTPVFTLPFEQSANLVRWSPDGTALATIADDGIIRVLDATTGELLATTAGHDASGVVAWSRDGTMLATGGYDGVAKLWDFEGRLLVERQRIQLQDFANGVAGLAFSPDGDRLAVGDLDITSTKIVDVTDRGGTEIAGGEAEPWLGVELGDGDLVRTSSADALLEAVDLTSGDADRRFGDETLEWPGAAFDHDGDEVAVVVGGARAIQVRAVETGEVLAHHAVIEGRGVEALALSPDGQHLAYAKMIDDFSTALVVVTDLDGTVKGRMEMDGIFTRSISFSADGARLAMTKTNLLRQDPERDGIRVWDWVADEVVGEISVIPQLLEFDPTGRFLGTTVPNESRAEIFDAVTLEPVATLAGSATPMQPIAFSADGSMVATGGSDGLVRVWDPATGAELSVLPTPATVRQLDFDETGDRLVSTDDTNTARVWTLDLDTLIDIAHQRVTRDLTPAECERYLQTSCPT